MSSPIPIDPPGPDEIRWGVLAKSLEEFQAKTVVMADEFSLAIPLLRGQGAPLPVNWNRQYVDWSERRAKLATEIASGLGVASVTERSFEDWSREIEAQRSELQAIRESEAAEIQTIAELVQRVQGLHATESQFNHTAEMEQARTLASILLERLTDPATRHVVMQDAHTMKGLTAVLVLVDGTPDSELEEQAVADVETMFSRKLSIALLRGRITAPSSPGTLQPENGVPANSAPEMG